MYGKAISIFVAGADCVYRPKVKINPAKHEVLPGLWRRRWDSNPRALADNLISRGVKRLKPLIFPHISPQNVPKKPVKSGFFRILLFVSAASYKAVFYVWAPLGHHRHHNRFNSWCFPLLFTQSIIYIVCFCLDSKYYFILV